MSVFKKAAEKKSQEKSPKATKKQTIWSAGDPESDKVAKAIHNLVALNAEKKSIEAKMGIHRTTVCGYAKDKFFGDYAALGVHPDTPMKIQNADGESVTFVVQERSQYPVKEESIEALEAILGQDGAAELIYEETVFSFRREILALPGVQDILGKHLEAAMAELVDSETLSGDQAESLLDAEVKKSFVPGVLQRLGIIAGKNASKMRLVCEALGSACVQYVKT